MAVIKTFTNEDTFWTEIESLSSWPERLAMSGGSAADFLDHVFVPDTAEIFLADERCVPDSHPDSNARLIRTKLKQKNFVDQLDFFKPGFSAAECAAEYELQLKTEGENLFDLVVLGVGPDGHTASLFPEAEALTIQHQLATVTQAPPLFAIQERLSLTFEALAQSKTVLVLLQGRAKQEIFETITNPQSSKTAFPARDLLDWDNAHIYWLKT
jgi:6-phosphogluconolactonase